MFSSLLLIIESDNKRLEVQLTTELACKLICHRKCWSTFQWQVARNVCFRLTLSLLIKFASSKQFIQLEITFYSTYIYTYMHNLRLRPSCVHIYYVPPTKTLVTDTSQFSWVHGSKGHYKFYSLSLDADIVPCWSGTASEC